jgi:hypothetical protein
MVTTNIRSYSAMNDAKVEAEAGRRDHTGTAQPGAGRARRDRDQRHIDRMPS